MYFMHFNKFYLISEVHLEEHHFVRIVLLSMRSIYQGSYLRPESSIFYIFLKLRLFPKANRVE